MTTLWRTMRRRVLTPGMHEAALETRGFHAKSPQAKELLETVGETFLTGYAYAAEARTTGEAEERLEQLPVRFRGFGYEGAGMAFAIRDSLPFGGDLTGQFLRGRGGDHVYMVYVGIGWAMARLPRFRWAKTGAAAVDPLLRWLVLDGYGFHQAYFHTARYVDGKQEDRGFPWPVPGDYTQRAIDQGIGRALWFVAGTDAPRCADLIDSYPAHRRGDLYGGAGLAATYAGGAEESEMRTLWERAGEHRRQVSQGSAFAAEARLRAGLAIPHTEVATRLFCGLSPVDAAAVTDRQRPDPVRDAEVPAFEIWRVGIADEVTAARRSSGS